MYVEAESACLVRLPAPTPAILGQRGCRKKGVIAGEEPTSQPSTVKPSERSPHPPNPTHTPLLTHPLPEGYRKNPVRWDLADQKGKELAVVLMYTAGIWH